MITQQVNDLLTVIEVLDTNELEEATVVLQLKSSDITFSEASEVSTKTKN